MLSGNLPLVYQLKITLKDIQPSIWRRVHVSNICTLADLHKVIQAAMGWKDEHLHKFVIKGRQFSVPSKQVATRILNESKYKLSSLFNQEGERFNYHYNFGYGWEHEVILEKILPMDSQSELPKCIEGRRTCPPEHIGGVEGYFLFLDAMADSSHPEHEEVRDWYVNDDFDPEHLNSAKINKLLQQAHD